METDHSVQFRDRPVVVGEFCRLFRERESLEVIEGAEWLDRPIREVAVNRPGLALTGFYQYFANERIQVFGLAELTYLKSLSKALERKRLDKFFDKGVPAVVVTRGRHAPPILLELAAHYRVPVLGSPAITGHFINQATLVLQSLNLPSLVHQGCAVDVMGVGVLIEGAAGIGKSEAALGLIERGHSLIADDMVHLRRSTDGEVLASAPETTAYHMEIRGLGIVHIPSLFGMGSITSEKPIDLVVELVRQDPSQEDDRSGLEPKSKNLLDIDIPLLTLPVAPGRDMTGVIEVAVLNQKLKLLGHDAAKEFDARLMQRLYTKALDRPRKSWRKPR